jgi:hypothetical protein
MKKLLITLSILLVLALGGYMLYQHYYPKMVADAIVNDKYNKVIPKKYQPKFKELKDSVNNKVDNLMDVAEVNNVSFDQLIEGIDEVQEDDVRAALDELKNTKIKSVEQVFEIGKKHIKIDSFDPEILREAFLKNVQIKHIKKGLRYIETHDLLNKMDPETAKAIAKQLILQKKEKIEQKTEGIVTEP